MGDGNPPVTRPREHLVPTTPLRSALQAAIAMRTSRYAARTDAVLLATGVCRGPGRKRHFADLVRRHGRLVRGTARRMVGDTDAAEDVIQATFLLLARKAASISWGPTVGPWLYQVTLRIAAMREPAPTGPLYDIARRADLPAPTIDPAAGLAWAEGHRAASRPEPSPPFPPVLRDPLVLCYLEGLTQGRGRRPLLWLFARPRSRAGWARGRRAVATIARRPWVDSVGRGAGRSIGCRADRGPEAVAIAHELRRHSWQPELLLRQSGP